MKGKRLVVLNNPSTPATLLAYVDFKSNLHLWNNSGLPVSVQTTDGQTVGTAEDTEDPDYIVGTEIGGRYWQTDTGAREMTYRSTGDKVECVDADPGHLDLKEALSYLKLVHNAEPFTIMVKVEIGEDSINRNIFGSIDFGTVSEYGFGLRRNSSNKLNFIMHNNDVGHSINLVSTDDFVVADGEVTIVIKSTGEGTNTISMQADEGTIDTADVPEGEDFDSTNELRLGQGHDAVSGAAFVGFYRAFAIYAGIASDQAITDFKAL